MTIQIQLTSAAESNSASLAHMKSLPLNEYIQNFLESLVITIQSAISNCASWQRFIRCQDETINGQRCANHGAGVAGRDSSLGRITLRSSSPRRVTGSAGMSCLEVSRCWGMDLARRSIGFGDMKTKGWRA